MPAWEGKKYQLLQTKYYHNDTYMSQNKGIFRLNPIISLVKLDNGKYKLTEEVPLGEAKILEFTPGEVFEETGLNGLQWKSRITFEEKENKLIYLQKYKEEKLSSSTVLTFGMDDMDSEVEAKNGLQKIIKHYVAVV